MNARLLVALVGAVVCGAQAEVFTFDSDSPSAAPRGWTAGLTGKGTARWTVEKDETAPSKPNVLKQSGVASYPICLKDDLRVKDGSVSVRFKALAGKEDQAAGLIWRAAGTNNYYVARANALEDNVATYHTINGKRTEKKRVTVKVSPQEWHTLRVSFVGANFSVLLDGKMVLEWKDQTFQEAGQVGLWTKADSVTVFDDFSVSVGR